MNKKILLIGVGVVVIGVAAFMVVASAGVPKPPPIADRGKDSYYTSDVLTQDMVEIMTNLRATKVTFVKIDSSVEYCIGEEMTEPEVPNLFLTKEAKLKDALMMLLSSKAPEDVASREQKELLKEEMKALIQKIIFPEKKGRVEGILFRDFKVQ